MAPEYTTYASSSESIIEALTQRFPDSVFLDDSDTFAQSVNSYWSLNACEFAVRSGGHSPEAGFSNVEAGIVIDMRLFNQVVLSKDKETVSVVTAARWADVYLHLEQYGVSIVGGRNGNVAVGGLILGGGVSSFSPRFGLACDNVSEYEIVLADGSVIHATSTDHRDLWRALNGGSGNFGIVTHVVCKTFPSTDIWSGYLYWTGWQIHSVLKVFYEFNKPENFDEYASGPILALSYVQKLGITGMANSFVYTKPQVFDGFKSLWRMWSTVKIQSLSNATKELDSLAPAGQRQFQASITIKNDLETFIKFGEIFKNKTQEIRNVENAIWSLVFQPLSPASRRSGTTNVLGLNDRSHNETLIIVLICASWSNKADDELITRVSRELIDAADVYAKERGTADRYRYFNYAASLQDPFRGYGEVNKKFLQRVSQEYDPDGFFQVAKHGGFKLDPC